MYLLEQNCQGGIESVANIIGPIGIIMADKEIRDIFNTEGTLLDKVLAGALTAVAQSLKTHPKEIITILAELQGEKVEEYENKNMVLVIADVIKLINDPQIQELKALFPSAQSNEI